MKKKIQVLRDGEVDTDYEPTTRERLTEALQDVLAQLGAYVWLQAKMWAFDRLHGTHYRAIHNQLAREKRNRSFEQGIGLVRT